MVQIPDLYVGALVAVAAVEQLYLAYRLGVSEGESGTVSASEADVLSEGES
jgi:hypothetical protein